MAEGFDALWEYDDPEGSESRFRQAFAAEPDDKIRAEIQTQIARTFSLRHRFEQCDEELKIARLLEAKAPSDRTKVRILLETGRRYNSDGKKAQALSLFEEAASAAFACGEDGFALDALHMCVLAADPKESEARSLAAIELAKASQDPRAREWIGTLHNNLGWSLFDERRLEEALEHFKAQVAEREKYPDQKRLNIAKWCVARCLRELGHVDAALELQRILYAANPSGPYLNEELALLYKEIGEESLAKGHAEFALNSVQSDDLNAVFSEARVLRLKSIAIS